MRGKGEGSIYRRKADGLWVASLELPTLTGQRRRRVITARTKPLLLERLKSERKRLEDHGDLPTSSQTVEQWLTYWLDSIAVKEVRPKTMANYRSLLNRHVVPVIGAVRLAQLSPAHVRRVAAAIDAKGLSSTTGLTVHRIMSSAFTDAEREGRIGRNPAKLTDAPRRAVAQLDVLTTDEVRKFLETSGRTPASFLWATFMLTGARRGELLGLTWDRVTDHLDLSWQLQRHPVDMVAPADYEFRRVTGGLYFTRPKSRAGWRVVPLVEPLRGLLQAWRAEAPASPHDLVFTNPDGSPIDPDRATAAWKASLGAAGIVKNVRLHDLRHTAVDLLTEAGVPVDVIMQIVGHSSRAMTVAYRSQTNRAHLTDAMERMGALLAPPPPGDVEEMF